MSDLMLTAVLSMPYDMAMADDLSRRQFYDRAQQALEVIERLTAERDAFAKEAEENKMRVITCGVAAEHSDANLTRTGAYAKKWDSAQAESVRRLRDERDELRRQLAEAERDAMAKDAERYRFLSCKGVPPYSHRYSRWRLEYWNGEWWDPLMKEELDAAIDAQIEQEKANGSR